MGAPVAITREVSPALAACQLTHLPRQPIRLDVARAQHAAYVRALTAAGYQVEQLPASAEMPDSVFVEDTAIVVDEVAVMTRPGAPARRIEVPAVADALAWYREVKYIREPGTIDGGDVVVAGRHVFVGLSTRTNHDAVGQMRRILAPHGYEVSEITVDHCLHLKSAATVVDAGLLLLNPSWIARDAFDGLETLAVDAAEPMAANALRLRDRVIYPAAFPRTAERLRARGLRVELVDASELAKAEGAVTCCSLIVG